jgi:ABC-type bacteriocin/lantibiotic exporter with double-glycine peptidase domain
MVRLNKRFWQLLKPLSNSEKRKLLALTLGLTLSGLLDLLGITLISLAGLKALSRNLNDLPFGFVISVLEDSSASSILGVGLSLLVLKSLVTFLISKSIFSLGSRIQIRLTKFAVSKLLKDEYQNSKKRLDSGFDAVASDGIAYLSIHLYAQIPIVLSESILIFLLCCVLVFLNPLLSLILILCISIIILFFVITIGSVIATSNKAWLRGSIDLRSAFQEMQFNQKVIRVNSHEVFFMNRIGKAADTYAKSFAKSNFLQQAPKYFIEGLAILSILFIWIIATVSQNLNSQITFMIFLMSASFRILPSIIRLQGAALNVKGSQKIYDSVVEGLKNVDLSYVNSEIKTDPLVHFDRGDVKGPSVVIRNVSYKYDGAINSNLHFVDVQIKPGVLNLIKGPSGVGKTTLLDLIAGLVHPGDGSITITLPSNANLRVGYMDQDTHLISGSILENITFGESQSSIDLMEIDELLKYVGLDEFIESLPSGLSTPIGLGHRSLSGGQRQRIGLARALYPKPNLLILDEPTNSVDEGTRDILLGTLIHLSQSITVVIVSHDSYIETVAQNIIDLHRFTPGVSA